MFSPSYSTTGGLQCWAKSRTSSNRLAPTSACVSIALHQAWCTQSSPWCHYRHGWVTGIAWVYIACLGHPCFRWLQLKYVCFSIYVCGSCTMHPYCICLDTRLICMEWGWSMDFGSVFLNLVNLSHAFQVRANTSPLSKLNAIFPSFIPRLLHRQFYLFKCPFICKWVSIITWKVSFIPSARVHTGLIHLPRFLPLVVWNLHSKHRALRVSCHHWWWRVPQCLSSVQQML